jgi:hypothetical protein
LLQIDSLPQLSNSHLESGDEGGREVAADKGDAEREEADGTGDAVCQLLSAS